MFETLHPLIQPNKSAELVARQKNDIGIKREYHIQAMEIILREAEKVLWKNPNLGRPELVDKILSSAREFGAHASETQRRWVEESVDEWTLDIGKEIDAIRALYENSSRPSRVKALDNNDSPWKLLEDDRDLKESLLALLPVESSNRRDFRFHVNRPPFIIIECFNIKDYQALSPYDESASSRHSSNGLAFINSQKLRPVNMDQPLDPRLEAFVGKIGVIRGGVDRSVRDHELQHLFYNRYVAPRKYFHVRAIDELAAYAKGGEYCIKPDSVFSNVRLDDEAIFKHRYDEYWREVRDELLRLQYHEVPAKSLWPIISTSLNLADLKFRLQKVKVDPDNFDSSRIKKGDIDWPWFFKHHAELSPDVKKKATPASLGFAASAAMTYFQSNELNPYLEKCLKSANRYLDPIILMLSDLQGVFQGLTELGYKDENDLSLKAKTGGFFINIYPDIIEKLQKMVNQNFSCGALGSLDIEKNFSGDFHSVVLFLRSLESQLKAIDSMENKFTWLRDNQDIELEYLNALLKTYCGGDDFVNLTLEKRASIVKELTEKTLKMMDERKDLLSELGTVQSELVSLGKPWDQGDLQLSKYLNINIYKSIEMLVALRDKMKEALVNAKE